MDRTPHAPRSGRQPATGQPSKSAPSKGELTKARLVDVAAQVFAEHGYGATTYEQLVQATGLSRGALYFHFPSKEKLAVEVLLRTKHRWLTQIGERVGGAADAATALRAVGAALTELHATDPAGGVASGLARESPAGSELRAAAAEVTRAWVAMIAGLVRTAQAEGGVRPDLDADQVAAVLYAAVGGLHDLAALLVEPDQPHPADRPLPGDRPEPAVRPEPADRPRGAGFAAHVDVLLALLDAGLFRGSPFPSGPGSPEVGSGQPRRQGS